MGPLYRTFWAVTASAALHVAAVSWGGGLLERESAPPPPDRITISLALFEPTPPPPAAPAPAPPAAPVKRRAHERKAALRPRPVEPVARVEAPARLPDLEAVPVVLPPPLAPPDPPSNGAPSREPPPEEAAANPAQREDLAFPKSRPDHSALVSSVREGIDAAKRYPRPARQAGFEGRALLKFRLLRSGNVADLRVLESSGHAILDEAALGAVQRAAPFPEEGRKLARESIEVILPVVFELQ